MGNTRRLSIGLALVAGVAGCQLVFSEPTFEEGDTTSASVSTTESSSSGSGGAGGATSSTSATSSTGGPCPGSEGCPCGPSVDCGAATLSCIGGVCVLGTCGDGVLNPKSETCDDGGNASGDGCGAACETIVALSEGWGAQHVCAILSTGAVKCWGSNTYGQLGLGDTKSRGLDAVDLGAALDPVDLGTGRSALQVATGTTTTCAVLDTHEVKCWGQASVGALGLGDKLPHGSGNGQMGDALPAVPLGQGANAVTVGANFACALLLDGAVKCWGLNDMGQLGVEHTDTIGDDSTDLIEAVDLGTHAGAPAIAIQISAGLAHVCAMLSPDNAIKCWGANQSGQLGLQNTAPRGSQPGTMGDALPLVLLGTALKPVGVRAGAIFNCVRFETKEIKCWGSNGLGQLGLGNTTAHGAAAYTMGNFLPFVDLGLATGEATLGLRTGSSHACAVLEDGRLKCWGANLTGALGLGNNEAQGDEPDEMGTHLPAIELGTGFKAVGVQPSSSSTCALLDDDASTDVVVKCWGGNQVGQLGLGVPGDRGDGGGEMGDALPPILVP